MSSSRTTAARAAFFSVIATYFLTLTYPGLNAFFNPDDVMNLFKEWLRPLPASILACLEFWSGDVRPLGQLAYRLLYDVFGWNPWPLRAACFAGMIFNLALSYAFFLRLAREDRVAAVALLAGCFHGALLAIYVSTGTIYDVLVQSFVLAALLLYVGRDSHTRLRTLAIAVLTVCAIQTKEMGYALPLLLGAYELVWGRGQGRWNSRWTTLGIVGAICMIGFAGLRFSRNGVHFQHPAYTLELSWHRYLETTQAHVAMLFDGFVAFTGVTALALLVAALLLALLLRSRLMLFGWLYFNLALLPLSFASPRAEGYVLYVPLTGFALWVAGVAAWWPPASRVKWTAALLCAVGVVAFQFSQYQDLKKKGFGAGGEGWVRDMTAYAETKRGALPAGARVAVVNDPMSSDYHAEAIFKLDLNRHDLQVERARCPAAAEWESCLKLPKQQYADVAVYENDRYRRVAPQ